MATPARAARVSHRAARYRRRTAHRSNYPSGHMPVPYRAIEFLGDRLRLLDQRLLPGEVVYREYLDHAGVAAAIRDMVVRGAPSIGATAAFGLALAATNGADGTTPEARARLANAADELRAARPTAVNLFWAIDRMMARAAGVAGNGLRDALAAEAQAIADEIVALNRAIATTGAALVPDGATIVHHCNTGSLAAVDYGTALGVVRAAHEAGKRVHVYVDETRPRLQGSRITAWELGQLGVPHTVMVDGAVGHLMRSRRVDLCLVGADRIAANGDTANKIGTYTLALVARAHAVPLYVAAPLSSVDWELGDGDGIAIEERSADEVLRIGGQLQAPLGTPVWNPAFDVTPAELIAAIVTEAGVARAPFRQALTEQRRRTAGQPAPR
jgi:methylthioribose-1-phosphate isomerase